MDTNYHVYILTNRTRTVLYVGMTNDIDRRVSEHRLGTGTGFAKRYRVKYLLHCERFERAIDAIRREKQLKKWNRAWKVQLINEWNPEWVDISTART